MPALCCDPWGLAQVGHGSSRIRVLSCHRPQVPCISLPVLRARQRLCSTSTINTIRPDGQCFKIQQDAQCHAQPVVYIIRLGAVFPSPTELACSFPVRALAHMLTQAPLRLCSRASVQEATKATSRSESEDCQKADENRVEAHRKAHVLHQFKNDNTKLALQTKSG